MTEKTSTATFDLEAGSSTRSTKSSSDSSNSNIDYFDVDKSCDVVDVDASGTSNTTASMVMSFKQDKQVVNQQDVSPLSSSSSSSSSFACDVLSSDGYVTFLRVAQYLSCVCLALSLFVDEFFSLNHRQDDDVGGPTTTTLTESTQSMVADSGIESGGIAEAAFSDGAATVAPPLLAQQIIYYLNVACPTILIHIPLYVGFVTSLPQSVRRSASRAIVLKKQLMLEGVTLGSMLLSIPLFGYTQWQSSSGSVDLMTRIVSIAGNTMMVLYYFLCFTSFRHYKTKIIDFKKQAEAEEEEANVVAKEHMQDKAAATTDADETRIIDRWTKLIIDDAASVDKKKISCGGGTGGAYMIFLRLMMMFPLSSGTAFTSLVLYTSCLPIQGLTIGYITQAIAEASPTSSFWDLFEPCLYFLLASVGMAIFLWTMKLGFAAFNTSVEEYYRLEMTRNVCCSNPGGNNKMDSGDLSSRFSRDIALIANFIDKNKLFTSSGILGSSILVLFTVDWRMGYFFAIICPSLIMMLAEKPGHAHKAGTLAAANLQGRFENCVELRRTMELYGHQAGEFVFDKSVNWMKDDMKAIGHAKWIAGHFVSAVHATGLLYTSLISLAFILFSIPLATNGDPTSAVNHLSAALVILSQLKSPFSQIGQGVEHWLSIAPALHRLNQCTRSSSSNSNNSKKSGRSSSSSNGVDGAKDGSSPTPTIHNSIELRDARFRYSGDDTDVLKKLNVKLETGKYTCIVGESGAGKSTLLNILTGELIPTEGSILVDGDQELLLLKQHGDTGAITSKSYRDQIAIVLQTSTFFDGTIADNIRLGKPTATQEEVELAAQKARCMSFIQDLPNGLNTQLGAASDFNLSGGQGQRVCLARALVRNPRLLILDEATSALDTTTEMDIVKTFVELAHLGGVGVVSVTHRLDTTQTADKVVVLKDGVVVEEGPPTDLDESKGLFYDMKKKE